MKEKIAIVIAFTAAITLTVTLRAAPLDTNRIEQITGLKGKWNSEEAVFKISQPRTDVNVSVDQWRMPPFMGLTSWAAFKAGITENAMVMGDLVLFQDEVNPVMSVLFENGVDVTALHNHFFYDNPKVYFMHIGGEGSVEKLAQGVQAALAKSKEIRGNKPQPAESFGRSIPANSSISAEPLQQILDAKPEVKDGMVKFVFGRVTKMPCGCEVGKEMGVNTWAAFAGTDDNAVVDGDFACQEDELQPVLRSLRKSGIDIVAIHHHMTHEQPRYLFLHYWGRGKAADLANAIRLARGEQSKTSAAAAHDTGRLQDVAAASARSVNFDDARTGELPASWTGTKTGSGEPNWTVTKDETALSRPNVLKQAGEADYPLALKDDTSVKNGFVEVKFKPISGKQDQAGGVVWRAKDADNYYICRANALEDNVVLYKTENGKRKSLDIVGRPRGYGVKEPVASGKWHALRVEFAGNRFKVLFNGKHLFDVEDDTFQDAGKVGLWTKADSVTLFDDFSYGAK